MTYLPKIARYNEDLSKKVYYEHSVLHLIENKISKNPNMTYCIMQD